MDGMSLADDASDDDGYVVVKGGVLPRATQTPACYLAVHGIQSADNLGQLLRTAGAFGCREVLVVNPSTEQRLKKARTFGAHGAERRIPRRYFSTLDKLVAFVRRQDCDVVGIEIHDDALPVHDAFQRNRGVCFLPGNEGQGLSEKALRLCDRLVYIPHFGHATASLNVNAATAVVLSVFATAVGYDEAGRSGPKFNVVDPIHDEHSSQDLRPPTSDLPPA